MCTTETLDHNQKVVHNSLNDDIAKIDCYMKDKVDFVLDGLTNDEMEFAASTSYQYQKCRIPSVRQKYASDMAIRYIESKSDKKVALSKMKATLKFREKLNLHNIEQLTKDEKDELTTFLNDKHSYVQGFDKDGRATFVYIPRSSSDLFNVKRMLLGCVWTIEKAIACTKSVDKTINVIIDFSGFTFSYHCPPLRVGKEAMTVLRNHYIGNLHKVFLLNVPTPVSILWHILKPFAGAKTRRKIVFASASSSQSWDSEATVDENLLSQYYCADESTQWMRPDGKKNKDLDVDTYLNTLPFDQAYDDENQ